MRRRHTLRVQWFWWLFKWLFNIRRRVIWSDVCTGGRNPTSKLGMRESVGGDFYQGGLALILSLCEGGGLKLIVAEWDRGHDLVLGHISPISQPPLPLQVIIAQSLICKQFSLERIRTLSRSRGQTRGYSCEPPGWYENSYMRFRTQFQLWGHPSEKSEIFIPPLTKLLRFCPSN